MTTLAPWREAGQHPQLQAAENVLLRAWLCPRPVLPEDVEAPASHTEMRIYAMHLPAAPGDPVDYVLGCVPAAAIINPDLGLARVSVDCYGDGGPLDIVDTVDVVLVMLGGNFLSESLCEAAPSSSTVLTFSDL
eukprot:3684123-Amphidinium_carterae.1